MIWCKKDVIASGLSNEKDRLASYMHSILFMRLGYKKHFFACKCNCARWQRSSRFGFDFMTAYTQNVLRSIFTLSLPSLALHILSLCGTDPISNQCHPQNHKKQRQGITQQSCKNAVLYTLAIFLQTTSNSWLCTCLFGDEGKEFCDCKKMALVVLDVIIERMYLNPKLGANTDFLK